MRFVTDAAVLAAAADYAAKATPTKTALPIMTGVRVVAREGGVEVSGFDPQISSSGEARIDANVAESGEVIIPGRMFANICSRLSGQVTVFSEGSAVFITAGASRVFVPQMPLSEYPQGLPDSDTDLGVVDAQALRDAARQVTFAAGEGDSIPVLMGVQMEFTKEGITLAATDRYRLANRTVEWQASDLWNSSATESRVIVVPAKEFADAVRGMTSGVETVTVGMHEEGQLVLTTDKHTAKLGSLSGSFPVWRRLLPTQIDEEVTFSAKEALEVINRLAIVAGSSAHVTLTFEDDTAKFEVSDDDSGGSDVIESKTNGKEFSIRLKPSYLRDVLAIAGDCDVSLSQSSNQTSARPVMVTASDVPDYSYVLAPIR